MGDLTAGPRPGRATTHLLARHAFAWRPVVAAMLALAVVLAVLAPLYGYHRDELYFRLLPPSWGYTDQPPPTPLLAQAAIAVLGDDVVALRVGWERYVTQIADVAASADADLIVTSNYGEAGALDRFGSAGVPVVSGHNALWEVAAPAADARTVVIVGAQLGAVEGLFATCEVHAELANGVGVDTEEEGAPIAVCTDPIAPWSELRPRFRHLD